MTLADTSVWVEHLRRGKIGLDKLLTDAMVVVHPFIIGELACGNLPSRNEILGLLADLPTAPLASQQEVLYFIEKNKLMGRGIGFIDAHLMASAALSDNTRIWTLDKRLARVAIELDLASL